MALLVLARPVLLPVRLLLVLLLLLRSRPPPPGPHTHQRTTPAEARQTWAQQPLSPRTQRQQRPQARRHALVLLLGPGVQQVLPRSC